MTDPDGPPTTPTPTPTPDAAPPPPPSAPPDPAAPAAPDGSAAATTPDLPFAPWSALGADLRLVAGAGIAAALVILVGGVLGAWPDGEFLGLTLIAAIVLAGAAWGAATRERVAGVPLRIVATLAAAALAAIAILAVIEALFDIDDLGDHGGILGLALRIALAVLAGLAAVTAARGDGATLAALRATALPARLAILGLALVLVGWAINLASYWTTRQAAAIVVVLVVAALLVALAGRGLPAMASWIGGALAVIGAVLAASLWGQLMRLGDDIDLDLLDFLPFLVIVVGLLAILGGAAQAVMAARAPGTAGPGSPAAPGTPGTTGPVDSGATQV